MKKFQKFSLGIVVLLVTLFSCQSEEVVQNDGTTDNENAITANSNAADLIKRTTLKDGSTDNIIDNANCLTVALPVTIVVDGLEIIVDSEEDFEVIEDIFDEFEDDEDLLDLLFPITIITSDFTEIVVNNEDQLEDLINDCNGENEDDDDIECIDFVYPFNVDVYNTLTEVSEQITINNDEQFYNLIDQLEDNELVTLVFPVSLALSDGSLVEANSLDLLENLIDDAEDDCDEDDDYDYDDDDCEDCTTGELGTILRACEGWTIDKFEINDEDIDDNFDGFTFNFEDEGTLIVHDGATEILGTWAAEGEGQNILVTLEVPGYDEFNKAWKLYEIEDEDDEKKVDLRLNNDNRLRFENDCN